MIDERWLVWSTTSRQSHLQTCLFADDCIMYGPLYEHSVTSSYSMSIVIMSSYSNTLMLWQSGNPSRAWNSILRNAVSWVYQDPDPLQTPPPLSYGNRTHHEYWRCNKVPGCRPPGYRFLEDTHRKYLQEAQQHTQDLKTQPQVVRIKKQTPASA